MCEQLIQLSTLFTRADIAATRHRNEFSVAGTSLANPNIDVVTSFAGCSSVLLPAIREWGLEYTWRRLYFIATT
jgi:hypothetical protein